MSADIRLWGAAAEVTRPWDRLTERLGASTVPGRSSRPAEAVTEVPQRNLPPAAVGEMRAGRSDAALAAQATNPTGRGRDCDVRLASFQHEAKQRAATPASNWEDKVAELQRELAAMTQQRDDLERELQRQRMESRVPRTSLGPAQHPHVPPVSKIASQRGPRLSWSRSSSVTPRWAGAAVPLDALAQHTSECRASSRGSSCGAETVDDVLTAKAAHSHSPEGQYFGACASTNSDAGFSLSDECDAHWRSDKNDAALTLADRCADFSQRQSLSRGDLQEFREAEARPLAGLRDQSPQLERRGSAAFGSQRELELGPRHLCLREARDALFDRRGNATRGFCDQKEVEVETGQLCLHGAHVAPQWEQRANSDGTFGAGAYSTTDRWNSEGTLRTPSERMELAERRQNEHSSLPFGECERRSAWAAADKALADRRTGQVEPLTLRDREEDRRHRSVSPAFAPDRSFSKASGSKDVAALLADLREDFAAARSTATLREVGNEPSSLALRCNAPLPPRDAGPDSILFCDRHEGLACQRSAVAPHDVEQQSSTLAVRCESSLPLRDAGRDLSTLLDRREDLVSARSPGARDVERQPTLDAWRGSPLPLRNVERDLSSLVDRREDFVGTRSPAAPRDVERQPSSLIAQSELPLPLRDAERDLSSLVDRREDFAGARSPATRQDVERQSSSFAARRELPLRDAERDTSSLGDWREDFAGARSQVALREVDRKSSSIFAHRETPLSLRGIELETSSVGDRHKDVAVAKSLVVHGDVERPSSSMASRRETPLPLRDMERDLNQRGDRREGLCRTASVPCQVGASSGGSVAARLAQWREELSTPDGRHTPGACSLNPVGPAWSSAGAANDAAESHRRPLMLEGRRDTPGGTPLSIAERDELRRPLTLQADGVGPSGVAGRDELRRPVFSQADGSAPSSMACREELRRPVALQTDRIRHDSRVGDSFEDKSKISVSSPSNDIIRLHALDGGSRFAVSTASRFSPRDLSEAFAAADPSPPEGRSQRLLGGSEKSWGDASTSLGEGGSVGMSDTSSSPSPASLESPPACSALQRRVDQHDTDARGGYLSALDKLLSICRDSDHGADKDRRPLPRPTYARP